MWHLVFVPIMLLAPCALMNYGVLKNKESTKYDVYICSFITTVAILLIIVVFISELAPKPTALDVYRGNTELKITSVNGVPTDTVVVFKNK